MKLQKANGGGVWYWGGGWNWALDGWYWALDGWRVVGTEWLEECIVGKGVGGGNGWKGGWGEESTLFD